MVTIQTLDKILKDFYLGPIIEALNSQIEMVQLFQKSVLDWSGRQVVIPVHVGRNSGVAFANESTGAGGASDGALPTAGAQTHVNLTVTAKYLYGRFSLSGPAIATAKTTANSFATYVQSEMDGLVRDVKVSANENMFLGGGAVGFIHQNVAKAGGAGVKNWAFSGNIDFISQLQTEARAAIGTTYRVDAAAQLAVRITRLDTYATVTNATSDDPANWNLADNTATFISGPFVEGQLKLTSHAGGGIDLTTLASDSAALVEIVSCGVDAGAAFNNGAQMNGKDWYTKRIAPLASGVYSNLGTRQFFGNDRSSTSNASLRSTVQSIDMTSEQLKKLDFGRMQNMLDEILVLGGEDPDCIYVHPGMRQEYASLATVTNSANFSTLSKDVQAGAKTADVGYSGYAFNNIPFKMSRHCGKGLLVFLRTKTWTIAELQSFGMADLDGNVLSRVAGADRFEGFVRWYYNLVCKEPNRNAILCGIEFPGHVDV
tara:strand:- start:9354 stop:10811 length:1458 start_codon:yes stop_codon:yes gene_type:complete